MSTLQTTHETNKPIKILKIYLAYLCNTASAKGQLISEWLFDVLNFPKKQRKNLTISAQESKKCSNHIKIKPLYNVFNT